MTITEPVLRSEHDRLKALLPNPRSRWASESIQLAQEGLRFYLGQKLTNRQEFHAFFREHVGERYAKAHDIAAASHLLAILIAEEVGDGSEGTAQPLA